MSSRLVALASTALFAVLAFVPTPTTAGVAPASPDDDRATRHGSPSDVAPTTSDTRPWTIPAIREWVPSDGSYTLTATSRIVARAPELESVARVIADDIRELIGFFPPVVTDQVGSPGDISLDLSSADPDIGDEGYTMKVGPVLTITAHRDDGVFYGTRTLLQLLRQSRHIDGGIARDWPTYPERIFMVDNGRKYFSVGWLRNRIKELAYLKYNYLHLHISDDQGFRVESSTVQATRPYLTKEELRSLVRFGQRYHITIIPEIDMPGHMGAILPQLPQSLWLTEDTGGRYSNKLNIANPDAYEFAKELIEEYVDLFPGQYWHLGADEFIFVWENFDSLAEYARSLYGPEANAYDAYIHFINWANDLLKSHGKILRVWGAPLDRGELLKMDKDVVIDAWDRSVDPAMAIDQGYSVANNSFYPTYYVLGWEQQGREQYAPAAVCDEWNPATFYGHETDVWSRVPDPTDPRLLGGKLLVWSDWPWTQSEHEVAAGIYDKLRCVAQNTWGSPPLAADYSGFVSVIEAIGQAPGLMPSNPDPTDIAYGKPANAQSDQGATFRAARAVDGDPLTYWSAGPYPQWWQVDLQQFYELSSITVMNYVDGRRHYNYRIETSLDGRNWVTVSTKDSTEVATWDGDTHFVDAPARYVRITVTYNSANPGVHIADVKIKCTKPQGPPTMCGSGS